jgi:hypothetical protein
MTKIGQGIALQHRFILWFVVNCIFYYFYCAFFHVVNWFVLLISFGLPLIIPLLIFTRVLIAEVFSKKSEFREIRDLLRIAFVISAVVFLVIFLQGQEAFGCSMPRHSCMVNEFVTHKQDFEQLVRLSQATENSTLPLGQRESPEQIMQDLSESDKVKWKSLAGRLPHQPNSVFIYRTKTKAGFEYWFTRYSSPGFGNHYVKSFVYTKVRYSFDPTYKFVILSGDWYLHTWLDG